MKTLILIIALALGFYSCKKNAPEPVTRSKSIEPTNILILISAGDSLDVHLNNIQLPTQQNYMEFTAYPGDVLNVSIYERGNTPGYLQGMIACFINCNVKCDTISYPISSNNITITQISKTIIVP